MYARSHWRRRVLYRHRTTKMLSKLRAHLLHPKMYEESEVRHRVLCGESFFFSCTRHVSMYLRRGIVIHSFIHSFFLSVPRGIIFISVLSHWCSYYWSSWVVFNCWVFVRALYVQWLQQMGCVEMLYQQMEHTHSGCVDTWILGVHTCNGYSRWVTSRRCTCDGYSRFTADGTHASWLRRDVHAWQNSKHALSLLYTVP
jgi:hypothetical protein